MAVNMKNMFYIVMPVFFIAVPMLWRTLPTYLFSTQSQQAGISIHHLL